MNETTEGAREGARGKKTYASARGARRRPTARALCASLSRWGDASGDVATVRVKNTKYNLQYTCS